MFVLICNSILLGVALAMDAFSVSLANGLNEPKMPWRRMALIAGVFAVFQALMPMAGWICVHTIVKVFSRFETFIPYIALVLLSYIGGKMLIEGIRGTGDTDEETAPVVKMIFDLCAEGKGPSVIANILSEKKILKPTMYRYQNTGVAGTVTDMDTPYAWNDRTVAGILDNEVFLGHTINCRTTVVSYKDKRTKIRPENEWYRNENTHEAIVDQVTWDIVRKVREGKRRRTSMGDNDKYSGLLYCADCGSKLYFVRGTTIKPEAYNFICSRYRKHMGEALCTPHTIREQALDEIVLEEIRSVTYYARTHTSEFADFIRQKGSAESRRELNARTVELGKMEKRNAELNTLFKRLYEDNVLGKVTNEQFRMLSDGYNEEQRMIGEEIPKLRETIESLKASATNVEKFLEVARKYTDLKELTPEILRTFIRKIVIHERNKKHSKDAEQEIDIYFTHIGNLNRFGTETDTANLDKLKIAE